MKEASGGTVALVRKLDIQLYRAKCLADGRKSGRDGQAGWRTEKETGARIISG